MILRPATSFVCLITLLLLAGSSLAAEIKSGKVIGRHIFGVATDFQGDPVVANNRVLIYDTPGNSQKVTVNKHQFLISGFNQTIGSVYLTYINSETHNYWDTDALKLNSVNGLSHPGEAVKTPWNTVLFPESLLLDVKNPRQFIEEFKPFFKGKAQLVNPYNYGWVSEVIVLDEKGTAKIIKNFSLGRIAAKQTLIMPDRKTLYLLDKLGNLYLFIADQANSLAKGKLYAVSQKDNGFMFDLLGNQSALKIKFKLKKASFKSIFKTTKPRKHQCKKQYTYVNTIFGEECLSLKKSYKKYAGYFDPIRSRALKGISEFVDKDSTMRFDAGKKQIIITQVNNTELKYTLNPNTELNSQFILKEKL